MQQSSATRKLGKQRVCTLPSSFCWLGWLSPWRASRWSKFWSCWHHCLLGKEQLQAVNSRRHLWQAMWPGRALSSPPSIFSMENECCKILSSFMALGRRSKRTLHYRRTFTSLNTTRPTRGQKDSSLAFLNTCLPLLILPLAGHEVSLHLQAFRIRRTKAVGGVHESARQQAEPKPAAGFKSRCRGVGVRSQQCSPKAHPTRVTAPVSN